MKALLRIFRRRFSRARALLALFLCSAAACLFISLYFFITENPKGAMIALLFLLIVLLLPPIEHLLGIRLSLPCYALLLFLCLGALLGSTFNFYFRIPFWDLLLHALSGWLFADIGCEICLCLFPRSEGRAVFPYLFVGVLFSLSAALLWELFEAGATLLLPVDMQEDTLVHTIRSFYLSGTHDAPTEIAGITETVIRYEGGRTLTLAGYLDLGLIDTLTDMAICLCGNLLFLASYPILRRARGRLPIKPSAEDDEN